MRVLIPSIDVSIIDPKTGLMSVSWYEAFKALEVLRLIDLPASSSTVANLPTVGNKGARAFVSDATATTFASIVAGGGTNGVPVYDDGTNWRIG